MHWLHTNTLAGRLRNPHPSSLVSSIHLLGRFLLVRLLVQYLLHPTLVVRHSMLLLALWLLLLVLVMLMRRLLAGRSGSGVVCGPRVVLSGVCGRFLFADMSW